MLVWIRASWDALEARVNVRGDNPPDAGVEAISIRLQVKAISIGRSQLTRPRRRYEEPYYIRVTLLISTKTYIAPF